MENRSSYHRHSLVEAKIHCIKQLSERVMSCTCGRQVNKLHTRTAILNRFTELGRTQTMAVAYPRLGLSESGLGLIYAKPPLQI